MKYLKSIHDFKDEKKNESVDDLDLNATEISIIEDGTETEDESGNEEE